MLRILEEYNLLLNPLYVKIAFYGALLLSPLLLFFEPITLFIKCMLAIGTIDIITGVMKNRKEFCSDRLWRRKAFIVILFVLGLITMMVLDHMLGQVPGHYVAKTWCLFYATYEAVSITENLEELGLPQAGFIMKKIKGKMTQDIIPEENKND